MNLSDIIAGKLTPAISANAATSEAVSAPSVATKAGIAAPQLDARRAEFVRLLDRAGCGPDHPDHAEALALALAFPGALETLRATCPPKGAV